MADNEPVKTMYELYGRVEQLEADVFELKKAVADLEAKTEPLQEVTNALNEFRQRLDAMDKMGKVGQ